MARDVHDTLAQGFTGIILNLEDGRRGLCESAGRGEEPYRACTRCGTRESGGSAPVHSGIIDSPSVNDGLDQCHSRIGGPLPIEHKDPPGVFRPRNGRASGPGRRGRPPAHCSASGGQCAAACPRQLHPYRDRFGEKQVQLKITDDGKGFDVKKAGRGLGLMGMRERAKEIGAKFELKSKPGKGTRVEVAIPRSARGLRRLPDEEEIQAGSWQTDPRHHCG